MVKTAQRAGFYCGILGLRTSKEITTMSNQINTPRQVHSKTPAEIKLEDQKILKRVANEAAEQAGDTVRRCDQGHDHLHKVEEDVGTKGRLLKAENADYTARFRQV